MANECVAKVLLWRVELDIFRKTRAESSNEAAPRSLGASATHDALEPSKETGERVRFSFLPTPIDECRHASARLFHRL